MLLSVQEVDRSQKIKMIEKVIASIARNGLHEFSLSSAAASCACSRQLMRHHFGKFKDLIEACFNHAQSVTDECLSSASLDQYSEKEALNAYIKMNYQWVADHPDVASLYLALFHLADVDSFFHRLYIRFQVEGEKRLKKILEEILSKKTSLKLSSAIHSLIVGDLIKYKVTPDGRFENAAQTTYSNILILLKD